MFCLLYNVAVVMYACNKASKFITENVEAMYVAITLMKEKGAM